MFDLPVVCSIGLNSILESPCANRIHFIPGDLRSDALPTGYDLHIFKSFLHDWSDSEVLQHLRTSANALDQGGKLMIFERIVCQRDSADIPTWSFCDLPVLLFERSYRDPAFYLHALPRLGFAVTKAFVMRLDQDFCLIEAIKSLRKNRLAERSFSS